MLMGDHMFQLQGYCLSQWHGWRQLLVKHLPYLCPSSFFKFMHKLMC
uniref:Uncharacterized protein n=1 Tax=Arundo donax TaxID=35708 RepID=A0A0A9CJ47_ARUDO